MTEAECLTTGCDPADAPFAGAQVDTIVEVDRSGNIVWEWSFWDHAIQNVDATKTNSVATGLQRARLIGHHAVLEVDPDAAFVRGRRNLTCTSGFPA